MASVPCILFFVSSMVISMASSLVFRRCWRPSTSNVAAFLTNRSWAGITSMTSYDSMKDSIHYSGKTSRRSGFNFFSPAFSQGCWYTQNDILFCESSKFYPSRVAARRTKATLLALPKAKTENESQMTKDALQMIKTAIHAVDPFVAVSNRMRIQDDGSNLDGSSKSQLAVEQQSGGAQLKYDLENYNTIKIFSFGKASAAMAMAAAKIISDAYPKHLEGVVVIKDGHATSKEIQTMNEEYNIVVRSASHPIPDERSVAAANEILQSAYDSDEKTLVIACISGGGSALFCSPRDPLTLEDLVATNTALLASGMPIEKMNVIRKRLENGKGGKLAVAAYPATVLTLVLSDIIRDPLDMIASGPTVPDDGSDWNDACKLVEDYGLGCGGDHELPAAVLELLQVGKTGNLDDTPKSKHPAFSSTAGLTKLCETVLVGNNDAAVMAAAEEAEELGYHPVVLGTCMEGEASCIAGVYVTMAEMLARQRINFTNDEISRTKLFPIAKLPCALIVGGETTVTLPPRCNGKGGRNQELALTAAVKLREMNLRDVVLASVGTDGTDGPTDAAGAIIDGGTISRLASCDDVEAFAKEALNHHDAYNLLSKLEDDISLIKTGPTGTNVADVCIILVR
mmetsp:Transcript_4746/g.9943  ORF Transcript_4746/g.9943 Transcript_4746/m.9943 type:complete len:626 (-) Transcript_4746:54-1931(-)